MIGSKFEQSVQDQDKQLLPVEIHEINLINNVSIKHIFVYDKHDRIVKYETIETSNNQKNNIRKVWRMFINYDLIGRVSGYDLEKDIYAYDNEYQHTYDEAIIFSYKGNKLSCIVHTIENSTNTIYEIQNSGRTIKKESENNTIYTFDENNILSCKYNRRYGKEKKIINDSEIKYYYDCMNNIFKNWSIPDWFIRFCNKSTLVLAGYNNLVKMEVNAKFSIGQKPIKTFNRIIEYQYVYNDFGYPVSMKTNPKKTILVEIKYKDF